jgi:hypothetical protein
MKVRKCSLCGLNLVGIGNNPQPVLDDVNARCCNTCNDTRVIPARIAAMIKWDKEKKA